ncbi:MAG TPA: Sec-independent protein translocase protein TatB [Burkholderiaceae bacterium]|jgi:sec-independent protein translocase protein TatB|nr:Sec-independent protein translocase protein TatB [Burkholderiaceae bacterium]HPE02482.1 Sec-independent protein translocase protein TatB [Burkholderiaceae bacterium]HRZ00089.1 Sec-independent protein translocase protein TatB [Burkholderiaceae bacterium]
MLDFSFGELALIGVVALVVLGPERLPKVARAAGEWAGKAQRYVSQVKSDINREMEIAELKRLQEQARSMAASVESQVASTVSSIQSDLNQAGAALDGSVSAPTAVTEGAEAATAQSYDWESGSWERKTFARRYKAAPSVDELAEELARLKRQLALPDAHAGAARNRYAPRARVSRPRIRR